MKLNKRTFAATFAALLIGGFAINPASAAVERFGDTWGDLSSITHGPATTAQVNPFGPTPSHKYSRADISSLTHRDIAGTSTGSLTRKNFGWSDISSITHN